MKTAATTPSFAYEFLHVTNGAIKPEIYIRDSESIKWLVYKDIDDKLVNDLFDQLLKFDKTRKAIFHLNGIKRFTADKRAIVEQIIKCNWAPLDDKIDMLPNTLNFEYVTCPHRGNCPFKGEGTVCIKTKPE